jgi:hypothetical protein
MANRVYSVLSQQLSSSGRAPLDFDWALFAASDDSGVEVMHMQVNPAVDVAALGSSDDEGASFVRFLIFHLVFILLIPLTPISS